MTPKPEKRPRESDLTGRYLDGGWDGDPVDSSESSKPRRKGSQKGRIRRTAALRIKGQASDAFDSLPQGLVVQVHSRLSDVQYGGSIYRCVLRKTLMALKESGLVVGDRVRFRNLGPLQSAGGSGGESDRPLEGVIEQILPRQTVLTRADSFQGLTQHPIVANADRMLIVASVLRPRVKWGLIDRMVIAALSGRLEPIICLNKADLAEEVGNITASGDTNDERVRPESALAHYASMGIRTLRTSVERRVGLAELREALRHSVTVAAGHSGVGKSSLIRAIQPQLDIRVGAVSGSNEKGRHTTTSARWYSLDFGGAIVDTPGVKLFGLWGVNPESLADYFPDIRAGQAPPWRKESFARILAGLPTGSGPGDR